LSGTSPISTSISHDDGIAVLTVSGEVDLSTVPSLEAAIEEALAANPKALIVDLTAVDFLASAGLQTLVATRQRLGDGTGFAVVAAGPATARPIELTGLAELLTVRPTIGEAMAALPTLG